MALLPHTLVFRVRNRFSTKSDHQFGAWRAGALVEVREGHILPGKVEAVSDNLKFIWTTADKNELDKWCAETADLILEPRVYAVGELVPQRRKEILDFDNLPAREKRKFEGASMQKLDMMDISDIRAAMVSAEPLYFTKQFSP